VPTTDWLQLDTVRTREKHAIRAGVNSTRTHQHGVFGVHSGPIDYAHFVDEVYDPALGTTMGNDPLAAEEDQRASFVRNERWLTTPIETLTDPEEYDAQMHVTGSAAHLHDFDPLVEWEATTRNAIRDDFLAANPSVTWAVLEWETNPFQSQPWGTHANRTIEITLAGLENAEFDRAGDPIGEPSTVLDHGVRVVPNAAGPGDAYLYTYNEDLGAWDSGLASAAFGHTWAEVDNDTNFPRLEGPNFPYFLGPFNTGDIRHDITDDFWDANAWAVTRTEGFNDYESRGLVLILGPAFAVFGDGDPIVLQEEQHVTLTATASIWFESDFTPPPYRIVYTDTPVAPVLRHYPRRGDGRGWGGVVRGYPPNPSRRGYGGARQP
jgi:hypothetical protein